jgi:hypothetical protein
MEVMDEDLFRKNHWQRELRMQTFPQLERKVN